MSKAPTIMLVKNRALGDSIMGLSAVQYLKLLYPESNIIYAVPQWIAPLYGQSITAADSIYPLKMTGLADTIKLFRDIKRLKVDHIHEMHQSGRGAKIFRLISFLLGIRYTAHNHHVKTETGIIDQGKILPLIQRDLDGLYSFLADKKELRPSYLNFTPVIRPIASINKIPMIIFGVVATRQTKMWPLEDYVELAHLLFKKFPHYQVVIPLSKSGADQKIKETLLHLELPQNASIVHWGLEELPRAFKQAALYVGNDTGLKHLAVAIGLKSYTFFGPEPANEWHPYSADLHPYFYLEGLKCRTRIHHYCGLDVCDLNDGNMHCLRFFKPEHVLAAIGKDLDQIV